MLDQLNASQLNPNANIDQELKPEEIAKKEKIRAAARDRQRKHRAVIKKRKMEQNTVPANDAPGDVESFTSTLQPYLDDQISGQMFASTLLLLFSCSPPLKEKLQSDLQMTNEELASLELILANAWTLWNRQVRYSVLLAAQNNVIPTVSQKRPTVHP